MRRGFLIFAAFLFSAIVAEGQHGIINKRPAGPEYDAAIMARYVINNASWASFGTISTNVIVKGFPMSNMLGISDGPLHHGRGIPYILMSHEVTGKDILRNANISLGVSLAQTGYCQFNNLDQQDPRCARVTFIGTYKNLTTDDPSYAFAKHSLRERHPNLENWKNCYLGKLDIKFIAVLDWFGGAKIVPVAEYLKVQPQEYAERFYLHNFDSRFKNDKSLNKLTEYCTVDSKREIAEIIAKFVIHNADWGTVTTLAYNDGNPNVTDGTPFNSIVSVADGFVSSGSGIPYIYVSPLEFLVKHSKHDARISLILTLAGTKYCHGLDPISYRCPAVILTGNLTEVEMDTIEYNFAQMALFSRHGSMARLPKNHHFTVNVINITYVQLIYEFCEMRPATIAWRHTNKLS